MTRSRPVHRATATLMEVRGLARLACLCVHIARDHERVVVELPPTAKESVHVGNQLPVRQQIAKRLTVGLLPREHPAEFIVCWSLVAVAALVPVRVKRGIECVNLAR